MMQGGPPALACLPAAGAAAGSCASPAPSQHSRLRTPPPAASHVVVQRLVGGVAQLGVLGGHHRLALLLGDHHLVGVLALAHLVPEQPGLAVGVMLQYRSGREGGKDGVKAGIAKMQAGGSAPTVASGNRQCLQRPGNLQEPL